MSGVSPAQQVSRRCVTLRAWKLRARGNGNRRGRAFRESLPCVKFRRSAHRPCTHAHGDAASDSATRTHIQEFDQTGSLDLSTLTNATVDILADAHTDTEMLGDTLASLFEGPAGANLGPWTFERVGGGARVRARARARAQTTAERWQEQQAKQNGSGKLLWEGEEPLCRLWTETLLPSATAGVCVRRVSARAGSEIRHAGSGSRAGAQNFFEIPPNPRRRHPRWHSSTRLCLQHT